MSVIDFPRRPVRPIPAEPAPPAPKTLLREWVLVAVCFALVVIAQRVLL